MMSSLKVFSVSIGVRKPLLIAGHALARNYSGHGLAQTEICAALSLVNGFRSQSAQR